MPSRPNLVEPIDAYLVQVNRLQQENGSSTLRVWLKIRQDVSTDDARKVQLLTDVQNRFKALEVSHSNELRYKSDLDLTVFLLRSCSSFKRRRGATYDTDWKPILVLESLSKPTDQSYYLDLARFAAETFIAEKTVADDGSTADLCAALGLIRNEVLEQHGLWGPDSWHSTVTKLEDRYESLSALTEQVMDATLGRMVRRFPVMTPSDPLRPSFHIEGEGRERAVVIRASVNGMAGSEVLDTLYLPYP